jgi:uncharacterized membrane protein YraQ (UPF0718 family)
MNSEAPPKHEDGGGGELEKRLTGVETRLTVIERTMVTAEVLQRELGALRSEIHGALRALSVEMHGAFGEMRKEMHAESVALRGEIAKMPFEMIKWLLAAFGIAAAITTAVYNIWFR